MISQYGFGNIVKCHFCNAEHHIVCNPKPNTLLSSPEIYETVMLTEFRPKPKWFCKPLYFDGIKYPVSSCITENRLVQCNKCDNYASVFRDEDRDNPKCSDCVSQIIKICDECDQYPLYDKVWQQGWGYTLEKGGSPAFECSNCEKVLCIECATVCGACGDQAPDERVGCVKCQECVNCCKDCGDIFCYVQEWNSCEGCGESICERCREFCDRGDCHWNPNWCKDCFATHKEMITLKCEGCGIEYRFSGITQNGSFGDDTVKLCDGCGINLVCIKCNSLEMFNENGNDKYYCNDCNQDDDTYIDDIDFKRYQSDQNDDIDIEQEFDDLNDGHDYTTMCLFHPI